MTFRNSGLGKTRLPSPWIPRRRRSYSQQTGRRRRIDSCQPASGKSPDTETQETRLQALQPFSQIISELEISSGEPKCTCWQVDRSSEAHGRQVIQFSAILPHPKPIFGWVMWLQSFFPSSWGVRSPDPHRRVGRGTWLVGTRLGRRPFYTALHCTRRRSSSSSSLDLSKFGQTN